MVTEKFGLTFLHYKLTSGLVFD